MDDRHLPTNPATTESPRALTPGAQVGRYVVLGVLGSGGMGIVYGAHDRELDRRVALKLIRPRPGLAQDSRSAVQQIQREAQVMAKLSHPNVVTIFDVGTEDGLVFLAMEHVEGTTLRAWQSNAALRVAEIVAMYVQAGRGLEAAHAAGILHRDFKPENVLVDVNGRARVLDFGVARALDAPVTTVAAGAPVPAPSVESTQSAGAHAGDIVGTPAYMAPEQMRGERADARSDQYAFSVALFEALYEEHPYESYGVPASALIRPPRRTPRARGVPRAIHAVLRRGLSRQRDERYESMGAMLAALERTLKEQTVGAVGAGVAILIAIGVSVTAARATRPNPCAGAHDEIAKTWGDAQRRAIQESLAATENPRASEVWGRVKAALDDYASRWSAMRVESCEATRVRGVQSDEALDLRTSCLDQRQRELGETVAVLSTADAPLVDRATELARAIADIAPCADVERLRSVYAEPRDPAKRAELAGIQERIARATVLNHARRPAQSELIAREAAADAKRVGSRVLEAVALERLAMSLTESGKNEEAHGVFLDAALGASAARDDETEARALVDLVKNTGYELGKFDEAELFARFAESAIQRTGSPDAALAELARYRGDNLYVKGDLTGAEGFYRDTLERSRRAFGEDSPATAHSELDLADIQSGLGQPREALKLYESAAAKVAASDGESSPRRGLVLINYAETLILLGEADRAVDAAKTGLALFQAGDVAHARMRLALGCALLVRGDVDPARVEASGSLGEFEAGGGPSSPRVGAARQAWAGALRRRHFDADAAAEAAKAVAILEPSGMEEIALSTARADRALALARTGDAKSAVALGERVLHDAGEHGTADVTLPALLAVGEGALAAHDPARALTALERAATLADKTEGWPEIHADAALALARALVATNGDASRARSLADRAAQTYDETKLPELAAAARRPLTNAGTPSR